MASFDAVSLVRKLSGIRSIHFILFAFPSESNASGGLISRRLKATAVLCEKHVAFKCSDQFYYQTDDNALASTTARTMAAVFVNYFIIQALARPCLNTNQMHSCMRGRPFFCIFCGFVSWFKRNLTGARVTQFSSDSTKIFCWSRTNCSKNS